jgi:hypothetical protein
MTKVVNLRQARKARARQEKEAKAETNRARYGRDKLQRRESERGRTAELRRHEGHRLDDGDGEGEAS